MSLGGGILEKVLMWQMWGYIEYDDDSLSRTDSLSIGCMFEPYAAHSGQQIVRISGQNGNRDDSAAPVFDFNVSLHNSPFHVTSHMRKIGKIPSVQPGLMRIDRCSPRPQASNLIQLPRTQL